MIPEPYAPFPGAGEDPLGPRTMWRWLGWLHVGGAALALAWLGLLHDGGAHALAILAVAGPAALVGIAMLTARPERLPAFTVRVALACASVLVGLGVAFSPPGNGDLSCLYLLGAPYAYVFFTRRQAVVQTVFVALSLAAALLFQRSLAGGAAGVWPAPELAAHWLVVVGSGIGVGVLARRLTETLREHAAAARRGFEEAAIGMALVGLDGRFQRVNAALCELLRRSTGDLLGRSLDEIAHPEEPRLGPWAAPEAVGGDSVTAERRYVRPDGGTVWCTVTSLVIRDRARGPQQLFMQFRDISVRRQAEEEASLQAGIVRAVLDATPDAIRLVDLEGNILLANRTVERMLAGLEGPVAAGSIHERANRLAEWTTDPQGFREAMRELEENPEREGTGEWELCGSGRVLQTYSTPLRIPSAREPIFGRLVIVRDVTAQRQIERARDEFVALASHELRTPLTSIRGYLELLMEGEVGEVAPEQLGMLAVIERNSDRLLRLVDDVLAVARGDAGRLGLVKGEVDLAGLAAACVQERLPTAAERSITLRASGEPALVRGDRTRLAQLIDNLVSNALKFTPEGGEVRATVRVDGDRAVLEVADTGVGIPSSEQPFLFERFYRGSAASDGAVPGTGLGLAIARMIAQAHDGRVDVSSEEGRGATFRVEIPLSAGTEVRSRAA
ncbi:MAG: hypothetical protein QOK40_1893 [Miltoncostaeaceae bacterium]|nr:hypothetical protein [Miltoncostaeaceae bacterium]